jgi:hypothetical protein
MAAIRPIVRRVTCPRCSEEIEVRFKVEAGVIVTEDGTCDMVISTTPVGSPVADHMCEKHATDLID